MTAIATTTDPFSTTHEHVADQLEPFCDVDLERFTERELLHAYDLASGWTDHLPIAQRAAANIAGEWQVRHAQSLPRVRSEVGYVPVCQTEVDDIWSGLQRAAKPRSHRRRLDTYFNFPRESTSYPTYGTH